MVRRTELQERFGVLIERAAARLADCPCDCGRCGIDPLPWTVTRSIAWIESDEAAEQWLMTGSKCEVAYVVEGYRRLLVCVDQDEEAAEEARRLLAMPLKQAMHRLANSMCGHIDCGRRHPLES